MHTTSAKFHDAKNKLANRNFLKFIQIAIDTSLLKVLKLAKFSLNF